MHYFSRKPVIFSLITVVWVTLTIILYFNILNTTNEKLYDAYTILIYSISALGIFLSFLLMYWNFKAFEETIKEERAFKKLDNSFRLGRTVAISEHEGGL